MSEDPTGRRDGLADWRKEGTQMHPEQPHAEIIRHMEEHYAPVEKNAFHEIVPGDPSISVHVIPPTAVRPWTTLFTAGMSDKPMAVPEGYDEYRFAELMIHLPADWPLSLEAFANPNHYWPVGMLKKIAYLPHRTGSWLGPPPTIISNDDPPERFAPNTAFTCMMLLLVDAEKRRLETKDGREILLHWMLPLYTEERDLELEMGLARLFELFDRYEVPEVVDINRVNVALQG
jgi:hypothetical protein